MKKKFTILITAALALLTMIVQPGRAVGQSRTEGDTHQFPQTLQQLLNNNATIPSIEIAEQEYPVKTVTISYRYNKSITNAVTMEVLVDGTSWGTQYSTGTGSNYVTVDFEGTSTTGPIVIDFTNNTGDGTGHGTFYVDKVILTEGSAGGGSDPEIHFNGQSANIGTNNPVGTEVSTSFIVYQSNLTEDITFDIEGVGSLDPGSIVQGANPTEVTWSYTPTVAGSFNTTITATSGTASATYSIYGEAKAIHNVNIAAMTNGNVTASPSSGIQGTNIDLTITPDDGYVLASLTVVDGDNNELTVTNNRFQMPDSDATVSASFEVSSTTEVIDVLNRELTGITGSSYNSWNNKTSNSDAVYAGNSAGGDNSSGACIQLRSNNSNSGIVTTASGGYAKKVVVTWNNYTTTGRTLNIYGKHTDYSTATELYNSNYQGTLLGTIVKGTSTELTINDDYEFIGMRSNSSAMYLDEIRITWSTEAAAVAKPTFSPEAGTYPSTQNLNVTISCETENSTIYYTLDGTDPTNESTQYTAEIPVTETTTIKAIAYVGTAYSNIATTTYTIVTPLATMQDIFDAATSTATNVYITFGDWVVSGASTSTAYVTDGTKGFIITNYSGHGFEEGDILSGTAQCSLNTNLGMARLQNFTSTAAGLTVTKGGEATIADIAMADLTAVNAGALLHYNNLLCTVEGSNYFLSDGTTTLQVYTSLWSGFTSVLSNGNYYNVTGVYHNFNTTKEICPRRAADITTQIIPSLAIEPATAQPFTYVEDAGPSDDQMFEVTGTNLTSDDVVATITTGADYFEITDNETYSSSVTVNSGDIISVRMKAGLALGNYAGALTLTNEGAEDVVVALSGSVTGQTYNIELDDQVEHGTIAADMTSAPAGVTVTLTATPDAGYEFGEWTVLDDGANEVTVSNNQFEMPASNVTVSATFTAKPTYTITTVVTPTDGGMVVTLDNAYEGQNVEVAVEAAIGFTFSSLVVSKTDDATTTVETTGSLADGFNFTMPNYAVTVTATFISDTYIGTFMKHETELVEGDYLIVYDGGAMNNTLTSKRFGYESVTESTNNIITNPSNNIVWHIAPSETEGYWTIYNEKEGIYVGSAGTSSDMSSETSVTDNNKVLWSVSGTTTHEFRSKGNENSTTRYIRRNDTYGFANYSTGTGGSLTLYKYTVLTERTITFNGNGGTYNEGDIYTQTVYDGIAANLDANKFTKEGSAFIGWSTTTNGEVEYADGASITVNDDLTLYAQWATSYTAMVDDQIVGGTVKVNDEDIVEVAAGTEMTLTYTAEQGYAFRGWNVYKDEDETTTVTVTDNKFTMPEYDVIVSATFENVATYSLVTNVNQIVSGKHYIIANKAVDGAAKAMAVQNDNNRGSVEVTVSNSMIQETEGVYEFVINGPFTFNEKNCYTIYDKNASSTGYLYAASNGSNYLRTKAELDANGKWNIEIDGNSHKATVKAQGNYTRNWMRNNGSLFSCYASGQSDIYLYVKDNDHNLEYYGSDITISDETLASNSVVVGNGSVVTFNGTNDNPDKLIIEDGGQIIHDNPNVQATIKKNIKGYGAYAGNYYFLVSPLKEEINPENIEGMTPATTSDNDFDLYQWNGSIADAEWRNYKKDAFTLNNGIGYLYANKNNVTLSFEGTLKESNEVVTVDLNYGSEEFGDWTLVGNPFACNAYLTDTADMGNAFYRMNTAGNGFTAVASGTIAPMEGIFVKASAASQSFKFTREAPSANAGKGDLNIQVAQVTNSRDAQSVADNAIIRFDGGSTLQKFSFRDDNAKIYFTRDNKDYAVVNAQAQGEMPVNFKAAENGTYTIDFSMDNVEFSYLHLIDNKTGMDIDLLQTSSYTFEASKIDYASRFKLVFSTNNNSNSNDDNSFAFFDANGNLMILGIEGTATLQVIDITGRAISNETFSGNYSKAINAKAGVYMLRLIQGNDVRTQKIVVR